MGSWRYGSIASFWFCGCSGQVLSAIIPSQERHSAGAGQSRVADSGFVSGKAEVQYVVNPRVAQG